MNLRNIILNALKTINEDLQCEALEHITEQTPLFEILDSLGTLDLILELESSLQNELGRYIAVANEQSMNGKETPFKTIVTLEAYLEERIKHESH